MNKKELEKIFADCQYSPEKIGVELLKLCRYFVKEFRYSNRPPAVYTSKGKKLY